MPKFLKDLDEEKHETIKDFISLALFTGARKDNLRTMSWENISFNDQSWYIPETKNDTPHLIPLVKTALDILQARFENKTSRWMFPSKTSKSGHLEEPKKVWKKLLQCTTCKIWLDNKDLKAVITKATKPLPQNITTFELFQAIQKQAKKDGIELPTGILDLRFHDLRRTLGSWLAHSGANSFIIGKSLNHKSPKSTAVYARLSIDPVRESMDDAVTLMQKNI